MNARDFEIVEIKKQYHKGLGFERKEGKQKIFCKKGIDIPKKRHQEKYKGLGFEWKEGRKRFFKKGHR